MSREPVFLLCAVALALALSGPVARAQTADPARASAAQALFDQANEEMEAGDLASACPKLEEVTKLIPEALGARMLLAECYEGIGKLASAWSQFAMVEGLAAKANQSERSTEAGKRAQALKPRLASITIELASEVEDLPGLVVTRDGLDVGRAQWGVASPADVGPHDIVVTAPGHKPWKKTVEIIADGAATTVKVAMLEADETVPAGPSGATRGEESDFRMPLAIGAMAVGGASLVIGAVLGGVAIAKNDESNESACNTFNQCTDEGLAMREQAVALGNGSTAMFVVGGVLAAGGAALFFLAWDDEPASEIALRVGPGSLGIGGRF